MPILTPEQELDELIQFLTDEEDLHLAMRDGCKKYSDEYNFEQKMFSNFFKTRVILEDKKRRIKKSVAIGHG